LYGAHHFSTPARSGGPAADDPDDGPAQACEVGQEAQRMSVAML
jgi:hypothetical protein